METQTPDTTENIPRVMLSVEQAAEALGIGRTTAYALIKSGELDSVRIGRRRLVPADAPAAYFDWLIREAARRAVEARAS